LRERKSGRRVERERKEREGGGEREREREETVVSRVYQKMMQT